MLKAIESSSSRRTEDADFKHSHTVTHTNTDKEIYSRCSDKAVNPHTTLTSALQRKCGVLQRTHLESDTLMPT